MHCSPTTCNWRRVSFKTLTQLPARPFWDISRLHTARWMASPLEYYNLRPISLLTYSDWMLNAKAGKVASQLAGTYVGCVYGESASASRTHGS